MSARRKMDRAVVKAGASDAPAFPFGPLEVSDLIWRLLKPGYVPALLRDASFAVKVAKKTRGRVVALRVSFILDRDFIIGLFPTMTDAQAEDAVRHVYSAVYGKEVPRGRKR